MKKPFSRYVDDTLDDEYRETPPFAETLSQNDLPQEEWEVRKYLENFYYGRKQLSKMNIFSIIMNFRKYRELARFCNYNQDRLIERVLNSPTHKAAMRRIAKNHSQGSHIQVFFSECFKDQEFEA